MRLWLTAFILSAVCIAGASADLHEDEIVVFLKKVCHEMCFAKIPVQEMCSSFCEFVDDIAFEHYNDLVEIWQQGGRRALEWALEDTVQWRMQSGNEDAHETAVEFLQFSHNWIKYLRSKDEL